jgi:CheY-like chemotaxis protein
MRRLALIDDCADNRLLIQALLGASYHITEYESGPPGLEGVRRVGADLVILDISLPGMSGLEVLRHLKADPATASIPVVALTAHAMVGDRERFLAAGFDDYVSKPIVDPFCLSATIERLTAAR